MKYLLVILLLLETGGHKALTQTWASTFRIEKDPVTLSESLTANLRGEKEKVVAIYQWIISHIDYQVRGEAMSVEVKDLDEKGVLRSLDDRVAESVLMKGVAVCEGYASLFNSLCFHAGIQSVAIHGYAMPGRRPKLFAANHTWNAVRIDSIWYLIDCTWASGYVSYDGKLFTRETDQRYLLADPDVFLEDHYPDDPAWLLTNKNHVPAEFMRSPFHQRSFIKYRIAEYFPAKGIINSDSGAVIHFSIRSRDIARDAEIGPDPFRDTLMHDPSTVFLRPDFCEGQTCSYIYTNVSGDAKWIVLLYNNDAVLKYYLKPKKD